MTIRTIAVFRVAWMGAAWCCSEGMATTLARLGYRVLDCGDPRFAAVPIEVLQQADLIMLNALEWYDQILAERYGAAWNALAAPKIAWYAESAHRDDRDFPFDRCLPLADRHYFPGIQDAEEFGGEWLPFGADTTVFNPKPMGKQHHVAFLGQIYPKRRDYIGRINFNLTLLPPAVDPNPVVAFERLAESYSATRIFVNLPSYSRLLVTKVTEIMACRTMLITPAVDHPSGVQNMTQFENGKHLVYYDPARPEDIAAIAQYYLNHPAELDAVAAAGCEEINRAHTLDQRLAKIIADVSAMTAGEQSAAQGLHMPGIASR